MKSGSPLGRLIFVFTILSGSAYQNSDAAACVWKVTSPGGGTLFLGGSAHALRSADYPLSENSQLGVEQFLEQRAVTNHKSITGLESVQEHMAPFVGLNDREGEALLLIHFINMGRANPGFGSILDSWRHGDADVLARHMRDEYQDFPAFMDRIVTARNRRWIPKIEEFIKSGQTYFVVAGAGHMGGSEGVVALLRARGYTIEQW